VSFLTLEEMRVAVGGTWRVAPATGSRQPESVSIDTRTVIDGACYIAIRGERHDGHDHLRAALDGGAAALLIEAGRMPEDFETDVPVLEVGDTVHALEGLARAWRARLSATVVAITGSAGKTTVRRLVEAICTSAGPTTASIRSFNNDIGLPLTILSARPDDDYLILEVGTNAPGEIRQLTDIARPSIALVTTIGRAHLEGLGSLEGIAREKAAIYETLPAHGVAVVPFDAPHAGTILERAVPEGVAVVRFGRTGGDLRLLERRSRGLTGSQELVLEDGCTLRILLPGAHNALNACAALAVGRALGIDDERIAQALCTVEPDGMRLAPILLEDRGTMILSDVYNANPDAVLAALETFAECAAEAPRRVVILGDMLELGPDEAELHAEMGRAVGRLNERHPVTVAVFVGERSAAGADALEAMGFGNLLVHLPRLDDRLCEAVADVIDDGDAVLVKASRGMALERIIDAVRRSGEAPVGELAAN